MFNIEALVYFTSYHDQGTRKWPKTPDDVLKHGCNLCIHVPADVLFFDNSKAEKIPEGGYTECWSPTSPADLCNIASAAVAQLKRMGVEVICSIHPRSILLPLVKWRLMRNVDNHKAANNEAMQDLYKRTVDLCECFYSPAVLTFEQRSNFGPDIVGSWLNLPRDSPDKEYGDEVILELWRRLF